MGSRIEFPTSEISSSVGGPLSIGSILVKPITIESVTLKDFSADLKYMSGLMKNSSFRVVISPTINYWYGFTIDYGFGTASFGGSGSGSPGMIDSGWIGIGDVAINGGNLNLDISSTTFGPFTLTPTPMNRVSGGCVDACQIVMTDTEIPVSMPPFGLNLPIPNPMPPTDVTIGSTDMKSFSSNQISIPGMGFTNVLAKNVEIDSAESGGFEASGNTSSSTGWLDLGVVGFQLIVDVTTWIKADNLSMADLSGDVSTGSTGTSSFTMDMEMEGVEISNLRINNYSIPSVDLSL